MTIFDWSQLTLEEARDRTAEWEQTRPGRLAWARQVSGTELTPTLGSLEALWSWLISGGCTPETTAGQAVPTAWYVNEERMLYDQHVAIGVDAMGHLWEEATTVSYPMLERVYREQGREPYPWGDQLEPALGLPGHKAGQLRSSYSTVSFMTGLALKIAKGKAEVGFVRLVWESREVEVHAALAAPASVPARSRRRALFSISTGRHEGFAWHVDLYDILSHDDATVERLISDLRAVNEVEEVVRADRAVILVGGDVAKTAISKVMRTGLAHWTEAD